MADQDSNKLYVGNMSYSTTEDDLHQTFSKNGTVTECIVIIDREMGRSRGFGFVTFESAADAKKAMEQLNGSDLGGKTIKVNHANSRGGGGGYRGGRGGDYR